MTAGYVMTARLGMRVSCRNFRVLRDCTIDLEPGVVTLLIGANGSGKSTVLDLFKILRIAQMGSQYASALESLVSELAGRGDRQQDTVLEIDDAGESFKVSFCVTPSGVEIVGTPIVTIAPYRFGLAVTASCDGLYLHETGDNIWAVLSAWSKSPGWVKVYEWVLQHARRAFPDTLDRIDFGSETVVYAPGGVGIDAQYASHGLVSGLQLLMAVAGAENGSTVVIDDVGGSMHPHGIRMIMSALRERADDCGLHVLITSHSTIVINDFDTCPEQVLVFESRSVVNPVRLLDIHDEDNLAQTRLGTLYTRLAFGGPDLSAFPVS